MKLPEPEASVWKVLSTGAAVDFHGGAGETGGTPAVFAKLQIVSDSKELLLLLLGILMSL